jgi:hypothetical protein
LEARDLPYVNVIYRDPHAAALRFHISELLRITPFRKPDVRSFLLEDGSEESVTVRDGDGRVDCEMRDLRFRKSGNIYVRMRKTEFVAGRRLTRESSDSEKFVRITSGLTKLDEVARFDVARQQVRRWLPVCREYLLRGGEVRHLTLPFNYPKLAALTEDARISEFFRLRDGARRILRRYADAGLLKWEWKIKRSDVNFHFHLIMLNRAMSKSEAVPWLGCIRTDWFEAAGGEYVNVQYHGRRLSGLRYITNYVNKPYVEVADGVDLKEAAGLMVRVAREFYRVRALMDYGLRRLSRLMKLVPQGFSLASERDQRKTRGVQGSRGGERSDPTYASHKENNSPLGFRKVLAKWRFSGLFFVSRAMLASEIEGRG